MPKFDAAPFAKLIAQLEEAKEEACDLGDVDEDTVAGSLQQRKLPKLFSQTEGA